MKSREIALISIMSALTVAVAYSKGLVTQFLPGLLDFNPVLIFVNGFCFGYFIGGAIGAISMVIYMIIPYPFAHPSAWIFTISPILLLVQATLGVMFGIVGGLLGRRWKQAQEETKDDTVSERISRIEKRLDARAFIFKLGLIGFVLTFVYQILSSIGFYLAYPIYTSFWEAIYLTFIPLYYPYPPIAQAFTNIIIFAVLGSQLIKVIKRYPIMA